MTDYQNRINNRLSHLYQLKKDWTLVLRVVRRVGNKEIEQTVTRACALDMEEVNREITRLEGMGGDVKHVSREPNFSRKGEDALIFDTEGRLNEAVIPITWGKEDDLPPLEPRSGRWESDAT